MWTRRREGLRTVEPGDARAIERALDERLGRVPARFRAALVARWQTTVAPEGLVLDGRDFVFFRRYGEPKIRVLGLLAAPDRLGRLLDQVLPWLQVRAQAVLSEAESWWRAFGLEERLLEPNWRAHGFDRLSVEVLEVRLPTDHAAPTPSAYRLAAWRPDDLDAAAALMASAPDPLQERIPTPTLECRDLLERTADLDRGALAWDGDRLAGLISASPSGDIGQLYVATADQGRGLGAALLDAALHQLNDGERTRVRLTMVAGNERAWGLYRSRGFRRVLGYPCRVWARH